MAQLEKNLPAMQETWVRPLGWEDPLQKGKATHSSSLAWRVPWTVQSLGSQRVGHNGTTFTFTLGLPGGSEGKASACNAGDPGLIPGLGRSSGEGRGNPLQYSCLENCMDRGALMGYSPPSCKELDMTE